MAGFLKNRRPFLSGYYLVDNLKRNYEIPSNIKGLSSVLQTFDKPFLVLLSDSLPVGINNLRHKLFPFHIQMKAVYSVISGKFLFRVNKIRF